MDFVEIQVSLLLLHTQFVMEPSLMKLDAGNEKMTFLRLYDVLKEPTQNVGQEKQKQNVMKTQ